MFNLQGGLRFEGGGTQIRVLVPHVVTNVQVVIFGAVLCEDVVEAVSDFLDGSHCNDL
jgi:hypothetical protein